jgi:hypothetical protein
MPTFCEAPPVAVRPLQHFLTVFLAKTCLGTKPVLANRRVLFDEKKKFPVPQMDHFLRHLYKKRSFCQDRLGINIGKTQKRVRFFFAPGSARRCSEG